MSTSPTTAPSTCEMFSTKPHPPKADARPLVSSSAYQRVPSPKVLARAQPYANGRTPTWPTSTQPEPATHPTEAINGHYRTRQTHRQRLPQPHQLPTPNAPHHHRPRHPPHPPTSEELSKPLLDQCAPHRYIRSSGRKKVGSPGASAARQPPPHRFLRSLDYSLR